uniref:Uncharacterized protein n=1 Tax=Leptocylindrus danicus TaxID=163516 RepID=A0A7S2PCZ5_9STRA|mmetsp:Transcript_2974/g.4270  ORF Transcript_2974/g.4270 Transcript_2974/m.4270 type:complete len:350 (+) Transcript_2974:110-1159(+)
MSSSIACISKTAARYQANRRCASIISQYLLPAHQNGICSNFSTTASAHIATRNTSNRNNITATLPEGYRPGQAYDILQKKGADTGFIRRKEFMDMCRASRPGTPRDAKMIVHALSYFKRTCDLAIDNRHAKVALEGMIRSMLPRERERVKPQRLSDTEWELVLFALQARRALDAALFCSDAILKKDTALYTSVSIRCVNQVLGLAASAVSDDKANIFHPKVAAIGYREAEDVAVVGTLAEKKEQVSKMLDGIMEVLTTRSSNPERNMKKRAARKYLKQVKMTDGPDEETIALIGKIRKGMEVDIEPDAEDDELSGVDNEIEGSSSVEESSPVSDANVDEGNEQESREEK